MPTYGGPAVSSPALDFLALIRGKERTPGGASAFAILEEDDRATLEDLLRRYDNDGVSLSLERAARSFLITYRELTKTMGVLDTKERKRLDQILDEPQHVPQPRRRAASFRLPSGTLRWVLAATALAPSNRGDVCGGWVVSRDDRSAMTIPLRDPRLQHMHALHE